MTQVTLMGLLAVAAGGTGAPRFHIPRLPRAVPHIVNGTNDQGDPAVIELYSIVTFAPADCNNDSSCLQQCADASGNACSSGSGCICGSGGSCTSSLIGPHTLLTAGHCTDLTAGGEIAGQGGPAMVVCTNPTDANEVLGGTPTPNCNLVVLGIFNNQCTTNDANSSCEMGLIAGTGDAGTGGGNFILVDELVNPGYNGNVNPPNNDDDVGLCHLSQSTLENGGAEPPLLLFNRTSEGTPCSPLGSLKFVGYGVTSGSGQVAGVKMSASHTADSLDDYHNFEGADPYASCNAGSGEPTCSGDSGGPSFNSSGAIMGTVSLGDTNCTSWGQDCRADAFANFFDCQMQCWGEPINGGAAAPDCTGYTCVYAPVIPSSSTGGTSGGSSGTSSGGGTSGGTSAGGSSGASSASGGSSSSGSSAGTSSGGGSTGGTSGGPATTSASGGGSSSSGSTGSAEGGSSGGSTSASPLKGPAPHATPESSGCSCGTQSAGDVPVFGALLGLGLATLRRRRWAASHSRRGDNRRRSC